MTTDEQDRIRDVRYTLLEFQRQIRGILRVLESLACRTCGGDRVVAASREPGSDLTMPCPTCCPVEAAS